MRHVQGMGEPLNNYEAVRSAVAVMVDSRFFSLRRSKVTVSTVGIIPRIQQARMRHPRSAMPHLASPAASLARSERPILQAAVGRSTCRAVSAPLACRAAWVREGILGACSWQRTCPG